MRYYLSVDTTRRRGGMVNTTTEEAFKPPYISFRTLTNLLDRLKEEGAPPQLDRSFLGGSEGYKTQVLAALRSLGLIGKDGEVLPRLTELANADQAARRKSIREIIEHHFPEPVRLGTVNATQQQLEDAFRTYGISGDTLRKSIAFYLKAAEYAGIPTSQHFKTPKVIRKTGGAPSRAKTGGASQQQSGGSDSETPPPPPPTASSMSVNVHTALAGVLMQLPPNGPPWTTDRREEFKRTFSTVLDFSYPVTDTDDDYEEYEED